MHQLHVSSAEAQQLIDSGKVLVNQVAVTQNVLFSPYDEVLYLGQPLTKAHLLRYYIWYKPRGVECTFEENIPDNLHQHLPEELKGLFYIGRLDKESEGLLLLTNDGQIHDKLLRPENKVAKKYVVSVNLPLTENHLQQLRSGIEILGKTTLPCEVNLLGETLFEITLHQGINRQIRRMCHKLGLEVLELKRIAFGGIVLGTLLPGQFAQISRQQLFA